MAKGGGAWKVAYADFVTAMMAFFLVMWICGQDQKIKQTVADYFLDPFGATKLGLSNRPTKTGIVSEAINAGTIPYQDSIPAGRGRNPYSTPDDTSRATKFVGDWLHADKADGDHWRAEAVRRRELAYKSKGDRARSRTAQEAAVLDLAEEMKADFVRKMPADAQGIYRDLLMEVISRVNWKDLAEDLLLEQ